jgi:alkylation response protein AidB-like acyl-CoA dehydrogenase
VGSFQAVQHMLANALIKLDFARPHVWRAAFGLDRCDPEAPLHVSMAKVYASEAAMEVARSALQVHGAMGYSTEMDLHLFMKRAWALSAAWGNAAHHQEVVAQWLLGTRSQGAGAS